MKRKIGRWVACARARRTENSRSTTNSHRRCVIAARNQVKHGWGQEWPYYARGRRDSRRAEGSGQSKRRARGRQKGGAGRGAGGAVAW